MSTTSPVPRVLPEDLSPLIRPAGKGRAFLPDQQLRSTTRDGRPGFLLRVRLTSYRSLPLSCIQDIQVSVDGHPVDPADMLFLYQGHAYAIAELCAASHIWWFILDHAELFVGVDVDPGSHEVTGTLVTVEPYITAGRFSFTHQSTQVFDLTTASSSGSWS